VLVGNKCDKEDRKVSYEEGAKLAKEFHMSFFETSAKNNYNIMEVFTFLTREILSTCDTKPSTGTGIKIDEKKDKEGKKDKGKCCK
jgi:GTPase SAR1 family protein